MKLTENMRRAVQLNTIRLRAEKAGIPFDIHHTDLEWPEFCPILGVKLVRCGNRRYSPSVDKIIPELGYVKGNVRIISRQANAMKSNATPEELLVFAKYIISGGD